MFKEAVLAGFVGAALFDLIKYIIRKVRKNKQNIAEIFMDLEELKKRCKSFQIQNQIKLNNHNQMKTKRHL